MSHSNEDKLQQFLIFTLKSQSYAVSINESREINRVGEITQVPQTPSYVAGVMNLRGRVIPIVDLRIRFGFPPTTYNRQTCIVVIEGAKGDFGVVVDTVTGV